MKLSVGTVFTLKNGKKYEIESVSKKDSNKYLVKVYSKLGFIGYTTFTYDTESENNIISIDVKKNKYLDEDIASNCV